MYFVHINDTLHLTLPKNKKGDRDLHVPDEVYVSDHKAELMMELGHKLTPNVQEAMADPGYCPWGR